MHKENVALKKRSQKPGAAGLNVTNTVTAKHQSEKAQ